MLVKEKKSNIDILLFSIGIIIKLFIIHHYIGIREGIFLITMVNFFMIAALFCLISFLRGNREIGVVLVLNFIISTIFFIDVMYFSHFYTLVPIHSIFQVGQLGPVSNSIFALLRVEYFLLFIDFLLLWRYYAKNKKRFINRNIKSGQKKAMLLLFVGLSFITTGMSLKTIQVTEGIYTPQNLGVINYHLADAVDLMTKERLDIENVEEVIDTISEVEPTKKGFSLAKDKNVIVIQAESLQNFVINKEIQGQPITPVLNQLIKEDSIYFNRYYEQAGWGNTSDAEFISHNSYYPAVKNFSYKAYENNSFNSLPMMLKERGYSTIAFHGNEASFWNRDNIYPSQGIDRFVSLESLEKDEIIGIGLSDGSLFHQSITYLKGQPRPFYGFFVTLSSHHPFTLEEKYKGLDIAGTYRDTILEDYLQSVHYLDKQLGLFIQELKKEGIYEDTIIVIYGDHEGLDMRDQETNQLLSSFLGKTYKDDEMFRVPLIIHMPGGKLNKEVSTVGGQIDLLPTLGNLLGLEVDSDKFFGKDLLNIKEGFVAKQVHVARGSFIDDNKAFIMSEDGIFENSQAWDINTGRAIDVEDCREGYERAVAEVNLSEFILQNDLIPLVQEKGLKYVLENNLKGEEDKNSFNLFNEE